MNKKIIFLDCDGTLFDVPRGMPHISDKTKYAVKELIKNGHIVFIASGRCKCILPDEVLKLNPTGYITANGACCFNDKEMIYVNDVDDELTKLVIDYCNANGGVYFLETKDYIKSKDLKDPLLIDFVTAWGIGTTVFTDDKNIDDKCQMMMVALKSKEDCKDFEEKVGNKLDLRKQYGFTSYDISEYGVHKGLGVEKILEYYHMSKDDAFAFGDGLNDIEMIEAVTNSYAMANGFEEIKEKAKYIAPDVLEDGFYQIMVERKLIKEID